MRMRVVRGGYGVGRRVHPDHRIARTVQQAIEHGSGDPARIVRRVVGL
jgi:hypothetical protein